MLMSLRFDDTRSQEQHKFGEIFHINKQINFPL